VPEETCNGGTPHKDKDPVKAERSGGRGAECGGCEPGGDGEITHGRGEQHGNSSGTRSSDAQQPAGQCRAREEQQERERHHQIAG
jgi:hypothetical protein